MNPDTWREVCNFLDLKTIWKSLLLCNTIFCSEITLDSRIYFHIHLDWFQQPNYKPCFEKMIQRIFFQKSYSRFSNSSLALYFSGSHSSTLLPLIIGFINATSKLNLQVIHLSFKEMGEIIKPKVLSCISAEALQHLTHLFLDGCWKIKQNELITLLSKCTQIQCLSIPGLYQITNLIPLLQSQSHLKQLLYLNLNGLQQIDASAMDFFDELQSIHLKKTKFCTQQTLATLSSTCVITNKWKHITRLDLKLNKDPSITLLLDSVGKYCSKLKVLDVQECVNINDSVLQSLCQTCQLQECNFNNCDAITENGLVKFVTFHCQCIRRLELKQIHSLTDKFSTHLCTSVKPPHLKILNLIGCKHISNQTLQLFTQFPLPQFYLLNLSDCPQVSMATLYYFS